MFFVQPLLDGYLVDGQDDTGKEGTTILHSPAWDAFLRARKYKDATAEHNALVMEFFKPVLEAAEVFEKSLEDPSTKWKTGVVNEGVEGSPKRTIDFDPDGVILHILDETEGVTDLLRWVGTDKLVALLK
jgi:hypothetical protein